ncbi:MAG: hypothetical protein AAF577_01980 [Pseudomonadota bacterium]
MLLELTLAQLDRGAEPLDRAQERGELGYLQWLGALPAISNYRGEAMAAYTMALPAARRSPDVAVFCDLLLATTTARIEPLAVGIAHRRRRGGARARRSRLGSGLDARR